MKKYLFILTFITIFFLSVACASQSVEEQPADEIAPVESQPNAQVTLSETNSAPNQQIVVQGQGFPPNEVVVIYYAESETNLGPAVAQTISSPMGDFQLELLTPTSWPGADLRGETRLRIVAETAQTPVMASAPITIEYDGAIIRFENTAAGYAIEIPDGWGATDDQMTPLGTVILLGPEPIYPGSPSNSTIITVDVNQLDELGAAQSLLCGSPGCTDEVVFNLTTVNGREAKSVIIGTENTPDLEWFFVTHEDQLTYFSIHDPLTLETIDALVQSFTLIEKVAETAQDGNQEVEVVMSEVDVADAPEAAEVAETAEVEEPTSTPILIPTDTPVPTETPTPSPTPLLQPTNTPVVSPTPTVEPTATVDLDLADPASIGPLQTVLDLLTILSVRAQDRDTLLYFSELAREELNNPNDIQDYLQLSRTPFAFQVERIQGVAPPVVRATVQFFVNSPPETIDLEMVQEEGRWRVNAARLVVVDPPPAEEPEPEAGEGDE